MDNNLVVCGGTFDHFHRGHEELLNYAFSFGGKLLIGLTSDEYIRNSKLKTQNSKLIENYRIRKENLEKFLLEKKVHGKFEIIKIEDIFGPTLNKDLFIDGIVVSEESKNGAEVINIKRKELGLDPLRIFIAPLFKSEDGKFISSGRIRNGEIDRNGKLYVKELWLDKNLRLTEDLRHEFQEPFGELLKDTNNIFELRNNLLFTVGDVTARNFNEKQIGQNLSIIDFNVARERKFSSFPDLGFTGNEKIFKIDNPAGYITSNLFRKLAEIIRTNILGKTILLINGEEDLAVLPLILLSPLGGLIFYGQPGKGLMKITVSRESKDKAYSLISKLKTA
jgi:pantetheine-phosphate adenylyltransferase